jgi:hypothetical protein
MPRTPRRAPPGRPGLPVAPDDVIARARAWIRRRGDDAETMRRLGAAGWEALGLTARAGRH